MPYSVISMSAKLCTEENRDSGYYLYPELIQSGTVSEPKSRDTESCMISVFVDQEGKEQSSRICYINSGTSSILHA
jgi:hypothetical protein